MENKHPIENLMKSTMENLKNMIDVNTIVGEGIRSPDGSFILPISKVSFGFASGGSEFPKTKDSLTPDGRYPFSGGSGSGVSVKPVAFLVIHGEDIRLLPVDANNPCDRLIDSLPQIIDRIKSCICKCKNKSESCEDPNIDYE
ncbi:MAG: GerW family sporulation protein [Sarcina sp.]